MQDGQLVQILEVRRPPIVGKEDRATVKIANTGFIKSSKSYCGKSMSNHKLKMNLLNVSHATNKHDNPEPVSHIPV